MLVAGVDGRRGGWALALATVGDDGSLEEVRWLTVRGQSPAGVREVLAAAEDAAAIGVDAHGLPMRIVI